MLPLRMRSAGERREYLVALGLVVVLQGALGIALLVSAAQTYRLWRQHVPYLPPEFRGIVPAVLGAGAAIALLAALRSLGRLRAVRRTPLEPEPPERHPDR